MTTKQDVLKAVQDFYGDTSRSRAQTRDGLLDLKEEIKMLIDSLDDGDDVDD